jgi:hypothetical protein
MKTYPLVELSFIFNDFVDVFGVFNWIFDLNLDFLACIIDIYKVLTFGRI